MDPDFDRSFRRMGLLVKLVFVVVILGFIGGGIYNYMIFKDCRAHGYAMFQCNAAINNPGYIAIDDMRPSNH